MGEFVGVDPANLRELANRLRRLHTLLADHGPAIQQKMQKWDSDLGYTALPRLIGEALDDARDMEARTTKAYDLAREKGWGDVRDEPRAHDRAPAPPPVRLDWAASGESGHQGEQDAETLRRALASKDPEQAHVQMAPLRDGLVEHLRDEPYLVAFWAEACPLALQAARALRNRSGAALFSAESASILRALGASLAAATQMRVGTGKDRRPLLSEATRAAIARNADPWSVGMLFKYGPDGKTWDSHFLAEVTRAMLDARASGAVEIPVLGQSGRPASPVTASETAPGGPVDAGRPAAAARAFGDPKLHAEFDPVVAVLDRATQNGQAARHVLGDPSTGRGYAEMLVSDQWHTPAMTREPLPEGISPEPGGRRAALIPERNGEQPGFRPEPRGGRVDLSSHAADFLTAAVSAARGASEDARESAWAVVAVVGATSAFSARHPTIILPAEIRRALTFAAGRYPADLAASVSHGTEPGARTPGTDPGARGHTAAPGVRLHGAAPCGTYVASVTRCDLPAFLRQALHDPKDLGTFLGILDAGDGPAPDRPLEATALRRMLTDVRAALAFTDEMDREAEDHRTRTTRALVARHHNGAMVL